MKKILTILVVCIFLLMNVSSTQAQNHGSIAFAGGTWAGGAAITVGTAVKVSDHVYAFAHGDRGSSLADDKTTEASVSVEGAYLIPIGKGVRIGPLVGPHVDWVSETGVESDLLVPYLVAAGGVLCTAPIGEKYGIWGYVNQKTAIKTGVEYKENVSFGFGFFMRL